MTTPTVLGYTTAQLIDAMLSAGIHTSVDRFRAPAIELQQRALSHAALERMAAQKLGLEIYDLSNLVEELA